MKRLIIGVFIGMIVPTLVGIVLLHYEYKYLQHNDNTTTLTSNQNKKAEESQKLVSRSIYVSPNRKWQNKPLSKENITT